MGQIKNAVERAINIIGSTMRSSGDRVDVFCGPGREPGARATGSEPYLVTLHVTYSFDLIARPSLKRLTIEDLEKFRGELDDLGLDYTAVMTALTLATVACK